MISYKNAKKIFSNMTMREAIEFAREKYSYNPAVYESDEGEYSYFVDFENIAENYSWTGVCYNEDETFSFVAKG